MVRMAETCKKYDIAISPLTSLAPLTRFPGGPIDDVIKRIGQSRGVTAAQVLLAWARQVSEGGPVVT
jgi:diketogulonate reductase-like aldo/keto reductase